MAEEDLRQRVLLVDRLFAQEYGGHTGQLPDGLEPLCLGQCPCKLACYPHLLQANPLLENVKGAFDVKCIAGRTHNWSDIDFRPELQLSKKKPIRKSDIQQGLVRWHTKRHWLLRFRSWVAWESVQRGWLRKVVDGFADWTAGPYARLTTYATNIWRTQRSIILALIIAIFATSAGVWFGLSYHDTIVDSSPPTHTASNLNPVATDSAATTPRRLQLIEVKTYTTAFATSGGRYVSPVYFTVTKTHP